jgi:hypothetical protein
MLVSLLSKAAKSTGSPIRDPGQAGKANSFGFFQPNHFSP